MKNILSKLMNKGHWLNLMLAAGLLLACTHKRDTQFVKTPEGVIYRIEPDNRCAECYRIVNADTSYNKLFKPCR